MKKSLTDRVLAYQENGEGKEELFHDIFLRVYDIPRRFYGAAREECSDFLMYMYPKLEKFVRDFSFQGVLFEHYFQKNLYYQYKNYLRKAQREEREWEANSDIDLWNMFDLLPWGDPALEIIEESELDLFPLCKKLRKAFTIDDEGRIENDSIKRRVVYAFLKQAEHCCDKVIDYISYVTGYCADWLSQCVTSLREKLRDRSSVFSLYYERKNRAFYHLNLLKQRYETTPCNQEKKIISKRIERQIGIIRRCRTRLEYIRRNSTNLEIAETMGVSKGSVDSGLFYLKKTLGSLYSTG